MAGVWLAFAVLQLVALACALQPWQPAWRTAGLATLALEAVLFAALFLPVFLFQRLRRGRSTREAARATVDALLDLLTGAVP